MEAINICGVDFDKAVIDNMIWDFHEGEKLAFAMGKNGGCYMFHEMDSVTDISKVCWVGKTDSSRLAPPTPPDANLSIAPTTASGKPQWHDLSTHTDMQLPPPPNEIHFNPMINPSNMGIGYDLFGKIPGLPHNKD
jgi:hypothetical protein